jgi:probable phosphomutase (TIGR03848 family)
VAQLLFLIRHARAEYLPGRLYGWTEGVHLAADGVEDAKRLAMRLEPVRFRAVYSSPLERCRQTAEAIVAGRNLEIHTLDDLGEVRYGSWQGRTFRSLMRTKLWRTVQLHPSQVTFPGGGESLRNMQHRAVEAVEGIRRRHSDGAIAIVSHADVLAAVVAHYLGMHLDLFQRIVITPASATVVSFAGGIPRLLRLSDMGDFEGFRPPKRKR